MLELQCLTVIHDIYLNACVLWQFCFLNDILYAEDRKKEAGFSLLRHQILHALSFALSIKTLFTF